MNVRELRKKLGLSQAELAEKLNRIAMRKLGGKLGDYQAVGQTRISEWESGGRNPGPLVRRALDIMLGDAGGA